MKFGCDGGIHWPVSNAVSTDNVVIRQGGSQPAFETDCGGIKPNRAEW
jgi:hypothetical protein